MYLRGTKMKTEKKLKITSEVLSSMYEHEIFKSDMERTALEEVMSMVKDMRLLVEYNSIPKVLNNRRVEILKEIGEKY